MEEFSAKQKFIVLRRGLSGFHKVELTDLLQNQEPVHTWMEAEVCEFTGCKSRSFMAPGTGDIARNRSRQGKNSF